MCQGDQACAECAAKPDNPHAGTPCDGVCDVDLPDYVQRSLASAGLSNPPENIDAGAIEARALKRSLGGPYGGTMTGKLLSTIGTKRGKAYAGVIDLDLASPETRAEFVAAQAAALEPPHDKANRPARMKSYDWRTQFLTDIAQVNVELIDEGRASRPTTKLAGMLALTAASESSSREEAFGRLSHMLNELQEKGERALRFKDEQEHARVRAHVAERARVAGLESGFSISPTMTIIPSPEQAARDAERDARAAAERERLRAEQRDEQERIRAVENRHRAATRQSVLGFTVDADGHVID